MSEINNLAEMLGISPTAVSKKLVFVKGSFLDDTWHIGDFDALQQSGGKLWILTLHGAGIPKAVEADSLSAVSLKTLGTIRLCAECVDEFKECFADIQKHPRARFVEFRKMLADSQSGGQIGGNLFEETFVKPYEKSKGH